MNLVDALASHAWIAAAAIVIGFLVRLLKGDTPLPFVPAKYRPFLALGFGVVAGALNALVAGTAWPIAVGQGLVAAMTAMAGHDSIVESLRGGIEFFSNRSTGVRKPPSSTTFLTTMAIVLAFALVGCTPALYPPASARFGGSIRPGDAFVPTQAECESLDSEHRTWGGVALGASSISGLSGLATGLDSGSSGGRLALGLSSLIVAGIAAAAGYVSSSAASDFVAQGCGGPLSPAATHR